MSSLLGGLPMVDLGSRSFRVLPLDQEYRGR